MPTEPAPSGGGESDSPLPANEARTLLRVSTRSAAMPGFAAGTAAHGDEGEGDLWLISYADMMTLLFAVFVIVVSIVGLSPKEPPGPNIAPPPAPAAAVPRPLDLPPLETPIFLGNADTAGFLPPRVGRSLTPDAPPPARPGESPAPVDAEGADSLAADRAAAAKRDIGAKFLASVGLAEMGSIAETADEIRIGVDVRALFDSRSGADVSDDGKRILARLYPLLSAQRAIAVEAQGINWTIGSARAAAVAGVLADLGLPTRAIRLTIRLEPDTAATPVVALSWSRK